MAANRLEIIVGAVDRGAAAVLGRTSQNVRSLTTDVARLAERSEAYNRIGRTQAAAAAGVGAALGAAAWQAAGYEQGMRNVNSITKLNEAGFQDMREATLQIARDPMILDMPGKLASGLYDIYSSGIEGKVGLDVLKTASQGAAAGQSDTATAARVLTGVMNAFNRKTGPDAIDIMDVLYKTVDRGVVSFDELAQNFTDAATMAAQTGVPLEQVSAAYMTMTKQGHGAAASNMALARVMTTFLSPSKALAKVIKEQGYESGLQILRTKGLAGAIQWLTQATGGQEDVMVQLLGEQRAVRAAMALTGNGAQVFAQDLIAAKNHTGAFAAALKEQSLGPMFQWKETLKQFNIEAISFGQEVLPMATKALSVLRGALQGFGALPQGVKAVLVWGSGLAAAVLAGSAAINLGRGTILRYIADWQMLRGTVEGTAAAEAIVGSGPGMAGGLLSKLFGRGKTAAAAAAPAAEAIAEQVVEQVAASTSRSKALAGATGGVFAKASGTFKRSTRLDWTDVAGKLGTEAPSLAEQAASTSKGAWGEHFARMASEAPAAQAMARNANDAAREAFMAEKAAARASTTWGKWAAQMQLGLPTFKTIFSGGTWKTWGTSVATGFRTALSAVTAFGKGMWTFLVSPAGVVIAALAALAFEAYKLYQSWQSMKGATEEAKKSEESWKGMQKSSQDKGYLSERQVARRLGFSDDQFDKGLSTTDSARVHTEFMRLRGIKRQERLAAAAKLAEQAQAMGMFGALAGGAQAEGVQGNNDQASADTGPWTAAQAEQAATEQQPMMVTPDSQYGKVINLTIRANTLAEIKALVGQELDAAFA